MRYLCLFKPLRNYLRGFLIAQLERVPKLQNSPFQKHLFIFSLACGSFFRKPRVCGEKTCTSSNRIRPAGSPPRMRGKVYTSERIKLVGWDHPRICGEKVLKSWLMSGDVGSPPRMRGKVGRRYGKQRQRGITPAYAGKRTAEEAKALYERDHPRVCGEKGRVEKMRRTRVGSPPHMRGKARPACVHLRNLGITPAYAGKRVCRLFRSAERRDHPRICGEKAWVGESKNDATGSPPHMRGKVSESRCACAYHGITPAYAGKSRLFYLFSP